MKNLEEKGLQQKPTQKMRDKVQGLRNIGCNIRDTVMAKLKLIAHKLRHKFGLTDNLTTIETDPFKRGKICRQFIFAKVSILLVTYILNMSFFRAFVRFSGFYDNW